MGYTTKFKGHFTFDRPLTAEHVSIIQKFNDTDHPTGYCQWTVNDQGTKLEWDQGEKFYNYVDWLIRLMDEFFTPWEYVVNGTVIWHGEEPGDSGKIIVDDNQVVALAH